MLLPHRKIRVVVVLVTLLLFVERSAACSCGKINICELVEQADVIFLGEVISGGLNPGEDPWSGRPQSATLRILEAYKGLRPAVREVTVSLSYIPEMCSPMVYRRGERTLAFLQQPERGGVLRDGACSASRFAKDTPGDLQYVRDYFGGRTQTTIRGRVAANTSSDLVSFVLDTDRGTPVADAQIRAEGVGGRFVATTDNRGNYSFSGLPAGNYRLSAAKPGFSRTSSTDSDPSSFQVGVRARGCAIQDLGLWANNSVQGVVRDSAGKPVVNIRVFLQKEGSDDEYGEEEITNDRGEFKFERIDPGRHYLTVSPFGATADSPYDPRFSGGVSRSRAEILTIEASSHLQSKNIELGPRIPVRSIRIRPEWPDGSRVSNSFILCGDARIKSSDRRYFDYAEEDKNGVQQCSVLTDRPYRIRATRIHANSSLSDTPEVVIPAGTEDVEIKIRVGPKDAAASRQ